MISVGELFPKVLQAESSESLSQPDQLKTCVFSHLHFVLFCVCKSKQNDQLPGLFTTCHVTVCEPGVPFIL